MLTNSRRPIFVQAPLTHFAKLIPGLFIIVLLAVGCRADQIQLTPPPGFQLVAEVDLSAQPHNEERLGELTLVETAVIHIFYTIPNIDTTYFDLSLSGPAGSSHTILHSEDYQTDENGGGTWEQRLPPGDYSVVLTASQTPGTLSVYWK